MSGPRRPVAVAVSLLLAVGLLVGGVWWSRRPPPLPNRPLRIGFLHDPPYMQWGPDGRPAGLAVEVISAAARRINLPLEWVYTNGLVDEPFRDGSIDLWPEMTVLPTREGKIYFSDPWLIANLYIVVRGAGDKPGADFTGAIGLTDLPVMDWARQKEFPRATSRRYHDGRELAAGFCAGDVDVAFLPMTDATRAQLDPSTSCPGTAYRTYVLNDSLKMAIGSRFETRAAADALRQELDRMARDGTLGDLVRPYSYYQAAEILAIFERLEARAQRRLLIGGIIALGAALLMTTWLLVALYTASRATAREQEARAQLEDQLRQSQKLEAVGRLAGGIAHDFNNLLTVVTGYSQLVLDDLPADSDLRAPVEEVKRAGDRAASLVKQLLAFSRRQRLEPRVLSLNAELASAAGMLQRVLGDDIRLISDLSAESDHVRMDPGQLHQIVLNLALNARDAMPQGGSLTIATSDVAANANAQPNGERPVARVRWRTIDTGVGMDAATQAHVFEPFFTTKPQGVGTGLGLATVYGIVAQSGGTIAIESMPGAGATFVIELPVTVDAVSGETAGTARQRPPRQQKSRVLVTEDQPEVRHLVTQVLTTAGYEVLEAGSGEEALDRCKDHACEIDLLLTDIVMPGMSGMELYMAARVNCPGLRVVYMSGYSDAALEERGTVDRSGPMLAKPFTPDALLDIVAGALRSPRLDADRA
jgi:signal transduction histidine kinase/ActR/RegA family two-component response regulator